MKESYVYILASKYNGTLYIGMTSDLVKRVWEHKNKFVSGFTAQYNVTKLVYYERPNSFGANIGKELRHPERCEGSPDTREMSRDARHDVVLWEIFNDIQLAAAREKRLKEWKRQWKMDLIQKMNPDWQDLYHNIIQ